MNQAHPVDNAQRRLLRFLTCGSVDDGKSSLIGRLLYDTKLIYEDQYAAISRDSRKHGTVGADVDLALLVDGLEAEREQGITIDVAYRFFSTAKRSFIVADTPGHEQFTRNMATGASTADVAVLLVDARKGLQVQTRRHAKICSLLGIRHVVLAVNKIDLVDYSQAVFDTLAAEFADLQAELEFKSVTAIPVSARFGDNVVSGSSSMPWYAGPTLLQRLETIDTGDDASDETFRLPVQWVNRPNSDFRGFSGTVASGRVKPGDAVIVASSGRTTSVAKIVTFDGTKTVATKGDAVTLTLADEVDVSRGDILAAATSRPDVVDQFSANIVWMSEAPLLPGRDYLMMCGTKAVSARITAIKHKVDIVTFARLSAKTIAMNDIAVCNIATIEPIAIDSYAANKRLGSFIIVDRQTNETVGAGMVLHALRRATNVHRQFHQVDKAVRAAALGQRPRVLWFTGLSGSGKSTIADLVEKRLAEQGRHTMLLDGDNMRHGLNRDLGFTDVDRVENIRRVAEVSKLLVESGLIVICSFISPFIAERRMVRELLEPGEFAEIFVDVPLDECIRRDPKGLYAKALSGALPNFTGVGSPYEAPVDPEIRITGTATSPEAASAQILKWLARSEHR